VTSVVLDTNVLVSLWIFSDPRYAALRAAVEGGRWQALCNDACLAEYERVLAYPQFGLDAARRARLFDDYRRILRPVAAPDVPQPPLPSCQDSDDQKFLELARDGGAAWLVTGDRALLRLARRNRRAGLFGIVTPEAASALLPAA
jgi:putative PIN family toxin of toxin-antitoxin system